MRYTVVNEQDRKLEACAPGDSFYLFLLLRKMATTHVGYIYVVVAESSLPRMTLFNHTYFNRMDLHWSSWGQNLGHKLHFQPVFPAASPFCENISSSLAEWDFVMMPKSTEMCLTELTFPTKKWECKHFNVTVTDPNTFKTYFTGSLYMCIPYKINHSNYSKRAAQMYYSSCHTSPLANAEGVRSYVF